MSLNTTPRTWVSGAVLTAAQLNTEVRDALAGIQAPWDSYTPTWTATSTNPSIGNGTRVGSYIQIGKTVHFRVVIFAGSTTTFGSGTYLISLPVTAANSAELIEAAVHLYDTSAATHLVAVATYNSSTKLQMFASGSGVTQVAPWTWANGDSIQIAGTYEAA